MTIEDRSYFYEAEVKHCAELLYTLAGVNLLKEETTLSDMRGNFSGYDESSIKETVLYAFNFYGRDRRKMRSYLRQQAARLTAEAAANRGYLIHSENN